MTSFQEVIDGGYTQGYEDAISDVLNIIRNEHTIRKEEKDYNQKIEHKMYNQLCRKIKYLKEGAFM